MVQYHTLFVRELGGQWFPDFGDFDFHCVKQEVQDRRESGDTQKGTRFHIVSHDEKRNPMDLIQYIRPMDGKGV